MVGEEERSRHVRWERRREVDMYGGRGEEERDQTFKSDQEL